MPVIISIRKFWQSYCKHSFVHFWPTLYRWKLATVNVGFCSSDKRTCINQTSKMRKYGTRHQSITVFLYFKYEFIL